METNKKKTGEIVKKIAKIGLEVALGAVFVLVIVVFWVSRISGSPVFLFGKATMWVMTGSMNPAIPARTYILVEKVSAEDVEVGDVIAFVSDDPRIAGSINTHRVVSKTADGFITKGDANAVNDGEYSPKNDQVVGRYVRTMPVLTFIGRIVTSQIGFAVVIVLFVVVTAVCYLPELKKGLRTKEKQEDDEKEREMDRRVQEEVRKMMEADKERNEANDDE